MEFGMLGPLEVREGSNEVVLGGPKQRKLFARLLVDRNRVVSLDSLIETLWPDGVPSDPAHQVQVYVSQIRKALGLHGGALETVPPGYRLRTQLQGVDLDRFESLSSDARSALANRDFGGAVALSERALELWRGPFLHGLEGEEFVYPESVRVNALRSEVEVDHLTASLENGGAKSLIPKLEARFASDPTDERSAILLMRALHREGRQGIVLAVFHRCRTALRDEMGIDPSPELQDLFAEVLRGDPPSAPPPTAHAATAGADQPLQLVASISRSRVVVGAVLVALLVALSTAIVLTRGPLEDEIGRLKPNSLGVIDPTSRKIVGDLTLPVRPTRAAVGFGALWVTSASSGRVVKVDPDTLSIRQEVEVGPGIGPIAFADSAVWVANVDDGTIARIDPVTNEVVQRARVGNGPSDMVPVGKYLWIANRLDASIAKFDARRGTVVKRIPVGLSPVRLAASSNMLWVTDDILSVVSQVDLTSEQAVSTIHVGNGAGPVIADADEAWVVNRFDGTVSHIGRSGSVEAVVSLGEGPSGIVDIGGVPWVAFESGVELIDGDHSGGVVASGAAGTDLAFGAGRVWVVTEPSLVDHSGGTLRLLGQQPDSMDPAMAYAPESWRLLDVTNDGLVAYGGPGGRSLVANLATRIPTPSDGGKTYVFQLAEGIRYSTGKELGPEDVRHSFERLFANGLPPSGLYDSIVGASACLNHEGECDLSAGIVTPAASGTVTFHLTHPDPDFLSKLAMPPASILPTTLPTSIQETVPSTGPYEVATTSPQQIVLERRGDFHPWAVMAQPDGYVDRILLNSNRVGRATRAVIKGEADWTDALTTNLSGLRRRFASQVHEFQQASIFAVFLNMNMAPFDDIQVRRALNLAVDRETVQEMFGGPEQATITCQILPAGTQGFEPFCPYTADPSLSGDWLAPDLQLAKRLLEGKERVPVTVWGFSDLAGTTEHIVDVLKDLGYPARSRTVPIGRFFQKISTRPDIQAGVFGWFSDGPGASSFITPVLGCASVSPESITSNYAHHCDPVIDRLKEKAGRLLFSDPQRATELWASIDRKLTRTAAWVALVNPKGVDLVSERLGNYTYSPVTGMMLSQVWVNE
jgi:ABC-type transport system substrate-binding protein/DNA-binding SARP family transcriptional activator